MGSSFCKRRKEDRRMGGVLNEDRESSDLESESESEEIPESAKEESSGLTICLFSILDGEELRMSENDPRKNSKMDLNGNGDEAEEIEYRS